MGLEGSLKDSCPAWLSVPKFSDKAFVAEGWLCVGCESQKFEDGISEG